MFICSIYLYYSFFICVLGRYLLFEKCILRNIGIVRRNNNSVSINIFLLYKKI